MRHLLLVLALCSVPSIAAADDVLTPADYLKILTESKQRYNILSTPSKTPIEEMRCPRRDMDMRVITKPDGSRSLVEWKIKPEAKKLLDEAETLYQAKKYEEAGAKYKAATEADPQAVSGYFFYGDTLLFGAKDAAAALAQYQKGIALDPTLPLGYFFASTAYVRLGRPADAREQVIKALTLHPAYEAVWKIADQSPRVWNIKPVVRHKFEPPEGYVGVKGKNGIDIFSGRDFHWIGYATCKAVWENEDRFRKQRGAGAGWSSDEERACLLNQIMSVYNATEAKLEEERKKSGKEGEIKEDAIIAALPPLERHLFDIAREHMIDGYIFFEIIGQKCPLAISISDADTLKQIEAYIRKYVIVAAE